MDGIVYKSWREYSQRFNCGTDDRIKDAFFAGANAFMWNMQQLPQRENGTVDLGGYIAGAENDFACYLAESGGDGCID